MSRIGYSFPCPIASILEASIGEECRAGTKGLGGEISPVT
jgi:hypothetical protein